MIVISKELETRIRGVARAAVRTPFSGRTWSELSFVLLGAALAGGAVVFVAATMAAGLVLAVSFFGLALIGLSLRGARGVGSLQRRMAKEFLDEQIEEPDSVMPRPGFLGWLQSALRDRTAWRAVAYVVLKVPFTLVAILTAISVWFDAFECLAYPLGGSSQPRVYGIVPAFFPPGYVSIDASSGWFHAMAIFCTGVILLLVAPWATRAVVLVDRQLMRTLLGIDAVAIRVRSLEHARAQTLDTSAATLRRIERDLHDGTQAQLVAVAMRLGMAKEKLANVDQVDLGQVRELVNDAHRGAKEAIVELRDLARGIHPPALDVGLEGALSTLAARSSVPTDLTITLHDRPTPAIEAIAYFCVAELLANVAQHAKASRASIACAQHGRWLRLVVRDDGMGGAERSTLGPSSSGLIGLTDRVHAVDGQLDIVSPQRGPTVITVDLPLHA